MNNDKLRPVLIKVNFKVEGNNIKSFKENLLANIKRENNYEKVEMSIVEIAPGDAKLKREVGSSMKNYLAGFPFVELEQIEEAWGNFIELKTSKAFITVLGTLYTLLFGAFTLMHWILFVITVLHFLTRFMANKYQDKDDYMSFSRNIQLFLWTYILLAVANILSQIVSINGFPEGTFYAAFLVWLIWSETRGLVIAGERAGLPIPPFLKKIKTENKNDSMPL